MVLDVLIDVYIVRLRGSLKSFLLLEQVLNFKLQPLNLFVKAVLLFLILKPLKLSALRRDLRAAHLPAARYQ